MSIFRRKVFFSDKTELNRHLKLSDLIFLGLGSIVGTGIFTIVGITAAKQTGPALVISFILAAIIVALAALIYAEFGSRFPANGGAYSYIYATLGEFPAWMAGWFGILSFLFAVASVASGWAGYLKGALSGIGFTLPHALSGPLNPHSGQYIDILAALVMTVITGLVLLNSKTLMRFNVWLVLLKFSALFLFIILGIFYLTPANWSDFSPYGLGNLFGKQTGIIAGSAVVFFTFIGFESISLAVDEVESPQKTVPRGIIYALGIVTVLYCAVALIMTGLVHYTQLNVEDALAFALRSVGLKWAANYIAIVAILTLITGGITTMYALSRIVYSISRDGLLPQRFSKVSLRHKVPVPATLFSGVVAVLVTGLLPLESLAKFTNIVTLSYLIMAAIGLLVLRRHQGLPTSGQFKVPLSPLLPILSILSCLTLMLQLDKMTWLIYIISIVIGTVIYCIYSYHHSHLNHD